MGAAGILCVSLSRMYGTWVLVRVSNSFSMRIDDYFSHARGLQSIEWQRVHFGVDRPNGTRLRWPVRVVLVPEAHQRDCDTDLNVDTAVFQEL